MCTIITSSLKVLYLITSLSQLSPTDITHFIWFPRNKFGKFLSNSHTNEGIRCNIIFLLACTHPIDSITCSSIKENSYRVGNTATQRYQEENAKFNFNFLTKIYMLVLQSPHLYRNFKNSNEWFSRLPRNRRYHKIQRLFIQ